MEELKRYKEVEIRLYMKKMSSKEIKKRFEIFRKIENKIEFSVLFRDKEKEVVLTKGIICYINTFQKGGLGVEVNLGDKYMRYEVQNGKEVEALKKLFLI